MGRQLEAKPAEVLPGPSGEDLISVLIQLRGGAVVHRFGEEMGQLVEAVVATEKAGSLTIVLKVSPVKGNTDALSVEAMSKLNIPRPSLGSSIFFPDGGRLQRFNPKQAALAFEKKEEKE